MKYARASRVPTCAVMVLFSLVCVATVPASAIVGAKDAVVDNLYATKLVSPTEGWVVGAFGVIFHTTDGGKTWRPQESNTVQPLFGVAFSSAARGWIVGRSGTILHTENGGAAWSKQESSTDKHLFKVDFVDDNFGVAVGDWGAVVVTSDGGKTWHEQSLTQDVILYDVEMLDRSHGWIVGEVGTVLSTDDGATTWHEHKVGSDKTLFGVCFTDANHGWLVGLDGLIIRTEDGGQNWQVQHGSVEVSALDQVQFSQSVENPSLYAVSVGDGHGYAVGEAGSIFASNDGGATWARVETPSDWGLAWLRAVSVVPDSTGLIVGAEGRRLPIVSGKVELKRED